MMSNNETRFNAWLEKCDCEAAENRFIAMNRNIEPNTANMYFNGSLEPTTSPVSVGDVPTSNDGRSGEPSKCERRTTPRSLNQRHYEDVVMGEEDLTVRMERTI